MPPPGRSIPGVDDWKHGYHYGVDDGRTIAEALSFFYYPTLYILDREGKVRYCGTCDENRVPEIVNTIVEEKPGANKTLFSPMMLGKGDKVPDFSAGSLEGKTVNFTGKSPVYWFNSIGHARSSKSDPNRRRCIAGRQNGTALPRPGEPHSQRAGLMRRRPNAMMRSF